MAVLLGDTDSRLDEFVEVLPGGGLTHMIRFTSNEKARPWLILSNHEGRPFHGEQYIALTLTTKSWLDGLIEIPARSWLRGGTPDESRIVPWGVQSLDRADIDYWQGRLASGLVDEAEAALIDELQ